MKELLRPAPLTEPSTPSLLRNDHFQVAYVTNDLDGALALLRERYGLEQFRILDGNLASGGEIRVAFAWVGSTMYEIIDAKGQGAAFYSSRLPAGGLALRFHHLGFLVHSEGALAALEQHFAKTRQAIVFESRIPGFMDAVYVEAEEFGHYLEYILLRAGGSEFFNSVPKTA